GGHRERRCAALERRDALFQHGVGRVADAGIDVAERLQPEQRGGVIGIVEHERRGLIDRRRPGAGGGIGLRARMHGEGRKSGKTIGHVFSFMPAASARGRLDRVSQDMLRSRGQSRQRLSQSRRRDAPSSVGNIPVLSGRFAGTIVSQHRHEASFLFFAARSDAAVSPPPTLVRFSESRMPWVGTGARFELSVRELTPIQEISDESRPYSILGQRFTTTLRPAASAFAAAWSSRAPSCIQMILGSGSSFSASSTTGMMWLELRKMSIMSTGRPISASEPTKGFPSRLLPTWPGLTGIMS